MTRCSCLGRDAGVAERHQAAVGGHREPPAGRDAAVLHERAALSLGAEPERLELADDLERERVVELGHVHVIRTERRGAEHVLRGATSDVARRELGPTPHVPRRCDLVGRTERVAGPAEDPHRRRPQVAGPVGTGEHQPAAAFGGHRAVEEVERVRDHPRSEHVRRRERAAPGVHRLGVHVAVVADRRGDRRELLGGGAVHDHVPPGHRARTPPR